jgi:hypothetical protein
MKTLLFTLLLSQACWVLADETIIINDPRGGQTVCIVQGPYVVCY